MATEPEATPRRLRRRVSVEATIARMRALDRRAFDLCQGRRGREVTIELPVPVRCGYERYWFIRPDLARSPEAPLLREILALVQRVEHSNRRDFAERDYRRGGKKMPQPHALGVLAEKTFYGLEERLQRHFVLFRWVDRHGTQRRAFAFKEPWKFVSRTRTSYLTHRTLPDSEALSEEAHIESLQWGKGYPYRHLIRIEGWGSHDFYDYDPFDRREPLVLAEEAEP